MFHSKPVLFVALILLGIGSGVIVFVSRPVYSLRQTEQNQRQETTDVDVQSDVTEESVTDLDAQDVSQDPEGTSETSDREDESEDVVVANGDPDPSPAPEPEPGVYTLAQVQQHATVGDCWSAINGSVYDLTSWVSRHPGGPSPIIGLCGADGSAQFNAKHGAGEKQQAVLITLKIGTLN